ncbi:hypothetical protein SAMN05428976_10978 [Clostridium sp. USBA 49]|uniref:hypothetical protein n=1 Tax=Clostridium sp. USBA 49 TaxID=1881060 RepID=UPI0009994A12|nr:hypothetical protein [Clostridium sp. USBA 49]SKA87197.1 hypothetical protein SAMN05428976_10978 [Clostridium sp. USBA 49]
MKNKEFMKKIYRKFSDFVSVASARELEYFVLDSKFTSSFNYRMKKIIQEIKKEKNEDIEFSILFNTNGEIAVIDANILGKHIGNNYNIKIEEYYKNTALNKIIRDVINGSEKSQKDFVTISYSILYHTLESIYSEIKCKKDIVDKYKREYFLTEYKGEDIGAVIACILILEDICKYIRIKESLIVQVINDTVLNKKI